jgi:type II secretory pathway component PulK
MIERRELISSLASIWRPGVRGRRGAVLLLVLGAVAVLTILAVEVAARANHEVRSTARLARAEGWRRGFDSGLEVAKALLTQRRKVPGLDHPGEGWGRSVHFDLGIGERVILQVADESGKLNLNQMAQPGADGARARKMVGRLFEYLARKDPGQAEAFKGIYQALLRRLAPAPDKKNGSGLGAFSPLLTLDCLRTEGLSATLIFGSGANRTDPSGNSLPEDLKIRLCDQLTAFGPGTVNINTAPGVLYALDEELTEELAERIVARRGGGTKIADFHPFLRTQDLELVPGMLERAQIDGETRVVKNIFLKIRDQVTVFSRCFSARVEASAAGRWRQAWGLFEVDLKESAAGGAFGFKLAAYEEIEP